MVKSAVVCLVVCVAITSCAMAPDGWNYAMRPQFMRISNKNRLGADHDWNKGFNDGCKTGMVIHTTGLPSSMSPEIDGWKITGRDPKNPQNPHPEIKSGKVFLDGWFDGFEHCTYYYNWLVL